MQSLTIKAVCLLLILGIFAGYNAVITDRMEKEAAAQEQAAQAAEAANAAEAEAQTSEAAGTDAQAANAAGQAEAGAGGTQDGASAGFRDGVYQGSAQGYGGTITVEVTIEDGRITDIQALEHSGEDSAYWSMCSGVIPRLIENQGEADTVSGATFSSGGIINATVDALEQAY